MNEVKIEGKTYFSFQSNVLKNEAGFYKLVNLKNSKGYIVREENIEEWRFLGYHNDDKPVLYGPKFEGISLNEILKLPVNQAAAYLERLAKALLTLEKKIETANEQTEPAHNLQLDSVYFNKNGEVLFLPFEVIQNIRYMSDENYKINNFNKINHPYNNYHSYTIVALLYKILTGVFPHEGKCVEEINNRFRNQKVIPVYFKDFEIKKEISDIITSFFNDKKKIPLTLSEWSNHITAWLEKGIYSNISPTQKQIIEKESKKGIAKNEKSYKQKSFIEKNGTKISIITISIVISSIILFSLLRHYFSPRVTRGFTPIQVVETFYNSINKLDHMTMSDCVTNKAGKNEINETVRLYAVTKQSEAYTHQSNIVMADKWKETGRKKLNSPQFVYGIIDLKIQTEKDDIFIVNYEKWQPTSGDEGTDIVNYEGYNITDKVYLKLKKKDWVIYRIDRLEKKLITN